MKQLKFNHEKAKLIREGKKTSTFRMFDDKDLTVNDQVSLLDKVDPRSPATWVTIGHARIDSIIEKRLGDVNDDDLKRYETFSNYDEMLKTFKKYYGNIITADTPIKVINFDLLKDAPNLTNYSIAHEQDTTFKLFSDGGSRGNPGPSAGGFVITDLDEKILVKKGIYFGITTNNQAEYLALKAGLEEASKMHVKQIQVYMDSLLVVNQMRGIFKIKNRDLWPIHDSVKQITLAFDRVTFTHIPRTLNKVADDTVNEVLDESAKRLK